ncbi:hypothetical protein NPX13_g7617 [Xylaria arbuscula]|uniref:Uncharacterized protein n=1 Tax=Xylaria arbuscula TaxID=114810 RepID=A0A9W8NAK3_9PEZI|nr:hypothetical protein NPX13_g7617 [Xylaria arbuscula]
MSTKTTTVPASSLKAKTIGSTEDQAAIQTPTRRPRRNSSAYSEEDARSIPQVPPIPDRFRPRRDRDDLNPEQTCLADPKGKEIADPRANAAPHTIYLPNCSIGKPKEVQVISNAMMQAYIAMRGNYLGGQAGNDPLFNWIQQREDLSRSFGSKIRGSRDVSRMLQLIDKALESSNMGGDSPRDCVFEVYRPDFEHIKPPHDMDMSAHIFASSCNDFEWEDDSDDDEADVPSGRISPCTFLEWSKDCVRWNADDREIKQDTTSYRRMRPPTPINTEPPRRHAPPRCHEHVPCNRVEKQWDINTGEELTPTYHVPNSPSIIYTPPGIEFAGFRTPNFHMQYRRMAPLAERDLRTRVYNGLNVAPPESSDAERDRFTASEVDAAAAVIPEAHNIRGAEVSSILREQYAAIQQAEEAERALYRHAELQREHTRASSSTNDTSTSSCRHCTCGVRCVIGSRNGDVQSESGVTSWTTPSTPRRASTWPGSA